MLKDKDDSSSVVVVVVSSTLFIDTPVTVYDVPGIPEARAAWKFDDASSRVVFSEG